MENNIRFSFVTYVRVRNSENGTVAASSGGKFNSNSNSKKFDVNNFTFLPKMIFEKHDEYMYLKLVEEIISSGTQKDDRTGTGTLSKFGCQVIANLGFLVSFCSFIFHIIGSITCAFSPCAYKYSYAFRCSSICVDPFRFLQLRYMLPSAEFPNCIVHCFSALTSLFICIIFNIASGFHFLNYTESVLARSC